MKNVQKIICQFRKPASRFEVVQLKTTMEEMLEKAGINDADTEIKGPTQVSDQTTQSFLSPTESGGRYGFFCIDYQSINYMHKEQKPI